MGTAAIMIHRLSRPTSSPPIRRPRLYPHVKAARARRVAVHRLTRFHRSAAARLLSTWCAAEGRRRHRSINRAEAIKVAEDKKIPELEALLSALSNIRWKAGPPRSEPANSHDFLPSAIPRNSR